MHTGVVHLFPLQVNTHLIYMLKVFHIALQRAILYPYRPNFDNSIRTHNQNHPYSRGQGEARLSHGYPSVERTEEMET